MKCKFNYHSIATSAVLVFLFNCKAKRRISTYEKYKCRGKTISGLILSVNMLHIIELLSFILAVGMTTHILFGS